MKTYYEYDSFGRIKKEYEKEEHSNFLNINSQRIYIYQPNKIIEVKNYFEVDTIIPTEIDSIVENYFSDGRIKSRNYLYWRPKTESSATYISFSYDEKNRLKQKITSYKGKFHTDEDIDTVKYFYDKDYLAYETEGTTRIRYVRDKNGLVLEEIKESKTGKYQFYRELSKETYQYDKKGRVYSKYNGSDNTTIYYNYDALGRMYRSYWNPQYFYIFDFCECYDYY